jgi:APA family basic amino acid/polyamine antiporter
MVNIGTLLAFVMVCGAVWIMRVREPGRTRPFKTPWLPFVATGGMLSNFLLMLYLPGINWVRLFVWLLIGFSIYFTYSVKHSKVALHLKNLPPSGEG